MQEGLCEYLIEEALESVFFFGTDGVITYANALAKEQLEYEDGLCGHLISEIFPGGFSHTENGFSVDCRIGGDSEEMIAYRGNRTCFPMQVKVLFMDGGEGTYICMGHDSSERVLLEKKIVQAGQEAEEAAKVKSEFVANVTHELRTPVNGILGNTKALVEMETDEKKLRLLSLVEHGCNNMHAIINNILDFSKLEAGKFSLELRKFNFRNMMDYVKANHINRITEKGLEFFVTISSDMPEFIIGDELRIVQVLDNLLSNACKFTSVGKIVLEVVKTAQFGNRLELFFMVIDSGIGINKADQDKLFQSFSQVDASITRKYGGTGLGLNICKQLVELMGGSIQVESQPNKGSMFSFHIWVEVSPEEAGEVEVKTDEDELVHKLKNLTAEGMSDEVWKYGEPENLDELRKKMSKLILCIEMENWEKAEMFADAIRQLTEDAPKEVKTSTLRLKMAVQKENYERAVAAFEKLQSLV